MNTNEQSTQEPGTEQGTKEKAERQPKAIYATLEDAKAVPPAWETKQRIHEVTRNGETVGFVWCNGPNDAIATLAPERLDGEDCRAEERRAADQGPGRGGPRRLER